MKKIFTSIGLLTFALCATAQEIEIFMPGETTDLSGTVVELNAGDAEMHQEFDVKNVSGGLLNLRIERIKILELEGTEDYLCWGATDSTGACYPAAIVSPENPFITPDVSPLEDGVKGWLSTYHRTNDFPGCAQYRYYVINDDGLRLDSIDVMFCSTVSITENQKIEVNVFPNPANELVTINLEDNLNNVHFKLFSVLGDEIISQKLNTGANHLAINTLPNGVYFYAIFNEKELIETKKLIVKH